LSRPISFTIIPNLVRLVIFYKHVIPIPVPYSYSRAYGDSHGDGIPNSHRYFHYRSHQYSSVNNISKHRLAVSYANNKLKYSERSQSKHQCTTSKRTSCPYQQNSYQHDG